VVESTEVVLVLVFDENGLPQKVAYLDPKCPSQVSNHVHTPNIAGPALDLADPVPRSSD
jgi:hypothetical protein